MSAPRVLIADDHGMIREGLRIMLERAGIDVVGEAADGLAAVQNAAALTPDVVLMDLRMPRLDGIGATREIVAAGTGAVLVLTSFDEDELVLGAIRAGAAGFLLKTTEAGPLVDAVRRVAAGEGVLDPRVTRRALAAVAAAETGESAGGRTNGRSTGPAEAWPVGAETLTARELDVLRTLQLGHSNAEIARALNISVPTVKTHVSSILVKLGAESRAQVLALTRDWPPPAAPPPSLPPSPPWVSNF